VALGKRTAQGPDTYHSLATADKAVDGNISDSVDSGSCAYTTYSNYSWWKVDLGRPYLLSGIKIYNRERSSNFLFTIKIIVATCINVYKALLTLNFNIMVCEVCYSLKLV